eukprot:COSAG02_NODE_708_length_18231_cov_53.208416_18_plen_1038_part_00
MGKLSARMDANPWRAQGLLKAWEQRQVAAEQIPKIARLWHSLCDPGFRVCAQSSALVAYGLASGMTEARRTEMQRSWLAKVGSGTVVKLALARRRLAFASQLLSHGIIVQTRRSAVPRLTHAEIVAERKARLSVLQGEEARWSASALEAAADLESLQREIEAIESLELEIERAHAALEAEVWTEEMKEQCCGSRDDGLLAKASASHQVAHRSRCLAGRGRCRLLLGNVTEALHDFEASLVAVPTSLEALWGKSQALEQLGRATEAAAAMAKHDKLAGQRLTPTGLVVDRDGKLAMSGMSVYSLPDTERSEVVLKFFCAGLPALHRTADLRPSSPVLRSERSGSALTAKWMGRKTLMILLAWQRWASGRAIFREQVKMVLRGVREIFTGRKYESSSQVDLDFVYKLPVAAVASDQNRHLQLTTAAADAMRGCEDLLRQKASWQSGKAAEPNLTGRTALLQEKKIASSLEYEAKAHALQGRLVQMHGQGFKNTLESIRRDVMARAEACDVREQNAKRALQHIRKEAVQLAVTDDNVVSEASKTQTVAMGPLFWKVILGNLTHNARKFGGGDMTDDDNRTELQYRSATRSSSSSQRLGGTALFASPTGAARQIQDKNSSHEAQLNGALDADMVQRVFSQLDFSLMARCSGFEQACTQTPPSAAAASSAFNESPDRPEWLTDLERHLALADLGISTCRSQTPVSSCWGDLTRQLVQHVLKFCEPPGLVAAAGSCRQLRACAMNTLALPQAMIDAHTTVAIAELKHLMASMNRRSGFVSAGRTRMRALMAQSKTHFFGLDDMDLFSVSLIQRPSALLEFVCEALWQITSTFIGDDGSAPVNEVGVGSTSIGSIRNTSVIETTSSSWFPGNGSMVHFSRSSDSVGTSGDSNGSLGIRSSYLTRDSWRMSSNTTAAQTTQHAIGSRWDLGRKALRAMISTGFLELDDPGGGPTFRSVLMAPVDTLRDAVRRLLPYTAILLGELERKSELRKAPISERVVSSLASFVVVIDAHLRMNCGLPAEVDAVAAEANAARIAEFCSLVSR